MTKEQEPIGWTFTGGGVEYWQERALKAESALEKHIDLCRKAATYESFEKWLSIQTISPVSPEACWAMEAWEALSNLVKMEQA